MRESALKPVDWIGSSYKDFRALPDEVQDHLGYALRAPSLGLGRSVTLPDATATVCIGCAAAG